MILFCGSLRSDSVCIAARVHAHRRLTLKNSSNCGKILITKSTILAILSVHFSRVKYIPFVIQCPELFQLAKPKLCSH